MPAPVAFAVHGSMAEPVYVRVVGQVTVTTELALEISNVVLSLLPLWLLSPAHVADAPAVPAAVLFV
jgi:hypothetical protein